MKPNLELTIAEEFLIRVLKSAGRGAGRAGAIVFAVPLGTFRWIVYDPEGMAELMRKPTWLEEVRAIYEIGKSYTQPQYSR